MPPSDFLTGSAGPFKAILKRISAQSTVARQQVTTARCAWRSTVRNIIEGPHDWPVRPVAEVFYESGVSVFRTGSALVGAIWQVQDNIAVDFGLRGARNNGQTVCEIRAGVTFAFGVTKGPDILSGFFSSVLHGFH